MSKKQLAFTLIELLVVIAIIGILSGLIVVSMSGITQKANVAKAQVFANSLRNSLMLNLISEWKLDGNGDDSWGSNEGTLSGVTTDTDCVSGSCYAFGSNKYISCGSISSRVSGTMMAWIKPSGVSSTSQTIMGSSNAGADVSARYSISAVHSTACSGNWYAIIADGASRQIACSGEAYNSTNFPTNKWVLLVVTYNGTNVKFYKNGTLINTVSQTVSGAGDAQPFSIGRAGNYNGSYYLGSIDEIRIFDEAISVSQIKEQYFSGLSKLLSSGGITKEEYLSRINNIAKQ